MDFWYILTYFEVYGRITIKGVSKMPNTVQKKVKLEYFRVVCTKIEEKDLSNATDILFDLNKWIALFDDKLSDIGKRVEIYNGEKVRLDKFMASGENIWILNFIRMRDSNIPKKAFETKEAEDMELDEDEYIGEEVIAIYDDSTSILALQRNRNSLSVTGIEKYMNEKWQHADGCIIHLRPILSKMDVDSFVKQNKKDYKKIVYKIADVEDVSEDTYDNSSLGEILKTAKNHEGQYIEIIISNGKSKKKRLNSQVVNQTLMELSENISNVKKAEVYLVEDEQPVEFMDLLSDKLCDWVQIEYVTKKSVSSDYLADMLMECYIKSKERIKKILNIV